MTENKQPESGSLEDALSDIQKGIHEIAIKHNNPELDEKCDIMIAAIKKRININNRHADFINTVKNAVSKIKHK